MEITAVTKTWTYLQGQWIEGNTPIMGVRTHAAWLCSIVFDGARAFEGVAPDLELHCERLNNSATKLFLKPVVSVEEWVRLAQEGIQRFPKEMALYIRPMYWAERGGPWVQEPDPESTNWCLCLFEAPMREPTGFSVTLSTYRRPTIECMPVDAKAGCLYPNNARALFEARARGFDNAVMCDMLGNVAEGSRTGAGDNPGPRTPGLQDKGGLSLAQRNSRGGAPRRSPNGEGKIRDQRARLEGGRERRCQVHHIRRDNHPEAR
jgi:branched-subunit amino acid aminotransferase/4-amino-4-deoxychorismate lyase